MFSQLVITEKGGLKLIHVSGQVGVTSDKNIAGGLKDQLHQAFGNLREAMNGARASMEDIVKLRIYVVGYKYEQAEAIRAALRDTFSADRLPALSLIGVAALADKRFLVEIDADAVSEQSD
jgi:enamine deaminase RidA (YjgF/YER057c/UK114 family)